MSLQANALEFFEERAAIMHHDGGLSETDAEVSALGQAALAFGWETVVLMTITEDGQH